MNQPRLPDHIRDEQHLEDLLSTPTAGVIETMARQTGDLLILGIGGKMGPSLARLARRASDEAGVRRRIVGVSRFSDDSLPERLQAAGIETIHCDLLDRKQIDQLPDAPNVVVMTGMKFGATGQESLTWAMNAHVPALLCEKYRHSNIVAFSTGNVYGLSPVQRGGSLETDPLVAVGEYAMSCVGRERVYEYFSRLYDIPMALLRLNYAHEMRYGVMVDIALQVKKQQPLDVSMGHFNALWQGDANAMALQAFDHVASPPFVVNLAGPEVLSVRRVAEQFAEQFQVKAHIVGDEASDAFLSNGQLGHRLFGYPHVPVQQLIPWIADWLNREQKLLGKPTHFENRQGKY